MKQSKVIIFSLLLSLPILSFSQGAFDGYMKPAGETDIVLSYTHEHYDTYFFGNNEQYISNTTRTTSLFLAKGLKRKDLNLIVSLPYMSINNMNGGIQDAIIGLKKTASVKSRGDWTQRNMAALGVSLPASNYDTSVSNPIGQKAVSFQPRGIVQFDHKSGAFFMFQSGADVRMFPDFQFGVPIISKVGFAASAVYFDLWVDYFHTFEQGVDLSIGAGQGSTWLKAGFNLYAPVFKNIGLIAGGGNYFIGRNIGLSWHLKGGVVYSIR